jgi:WD40 repeat protein
VRTSAEVGAFAGDGTSVEACCFSPDGRRLLFASSAGGLWSCDVRGAGTTLTFSGHSDRVSRCAFTPDGRRVASASYDRTLRVWDAETGDELACFPSNQPLRSLDVHPYEPLVAAGDAEGAFYLLRLVGPRPGPPIVTAAALFRAPAAGRSAGTGT